MNLDVILPFLSGLISGSIVPLVLRFLDHKKANTEADFNIAQSANEIAEGGEKAVVAVTKILEIYEKRNAEQMAEINSLRAQLTSMMIDERAKEARLNLEIEALKGYIKLLVDIIRNNNMEVPPRPDILKETDPKIKAVRQ